MPNPTESFRSGACRKYFDTRGAAQGARVSSVYGRRRHPVYGDIRMHSGVDFAAALGTPVYATGPGRIRFIGRRGGYGRMVEISHGSSTMTRYAHLKAIPEGVREGQQVAAGDRIGSIGSSRTATGPNLHYEVRVDGRTTDPLAEDQNIAISRTTQSGEMALERLVRARADLQQLMTEQSPTQRTSSES